jgi:hypothetical protein
LAPVVYRLQSTDSGFWFDISGLSFKPVNDVGPMIDYRATGLLARAIVIWLATAIIGGIALAAQISFVARIFHAPEFAEHRTMGFLMAAVLGLGLAICFMITSIRAPYLDR